MCTMMTWTYAQLLLLGLFYSSRTLPSLIMLQLLYEFIMKSERQAVCTHT